MNFAAWRATECCFLLECCLMRATIVAFASRTQSFPESAYILKAFVKTLSFIDKEKRAITRSQ
jgi:hypothetical protein